MARSFGSGNSIDTSSYAIPAASSLAGWINLASLPGSFMIPVSHNSSNSNATGVSVLINASSQLQAKAVATGGAVGAIGSTALTAGTWTHFAAVYDSVNGGVIYFNGVSNGTAAANGTITSGTGPLHIGWDGSGFSVGGNAPGSRLADVAEWNTNLAASDVAKLAAGWRPNAVNSANLIAWLPLGTNSQLGPEPDVSGNNNNGTLTGTTVVASPDILNRGGRLFNGSSDFISAVSPSVSNTVSMSCWFYPTNNSVLQDAFGIGENQAAPNYQRMGVRGDLGTKDFFIASHCGTAVVFNTGTAPKFNAWNHGAASIVMNGGNITAWLNGVNLGTTATLAGTATFTNVCIGALFNASSSPSLFFNGKVADCAWWNGIALGSTDIANLFNGVRPGNVQAGSIAGWWPLDGYQTTENDLSSGAHNGTATSTLAEGLGPPPLWRVFGS